MRLLVSDYSGHPFQVQLSRALAGRGHEVTHVYFAGFQTPKGALASQASDPASFFIRPICIDQPFAKERFIRRRRQEIQVGAAIAAVINEVRPNAVLSANAPLDTQKRILGAARACGAHFYFWLQDIYSVAIAKVLSQRFGLLGRLIGMHYCNLELKMLEQSDGIIAISENFCRFLREHRIATSVSVVENWAPIDSLLVGRRSSNERARFRFVYSGTLGYKHNPELLVLLAETLGAEVHVYSEGPAAKYLRAEAERRSLADRLRIFDWVPFDQLPAVLDDADSLVAILEADAGAYSVPSKVLSYLCTGKPLLLSVPHENLAARIVEREQAGLVAPPERSDTFLAEAARLMGNPALCATLGRNGLSYANRAFNIKTITDRFERALTIPTVTRTQLRPQAAA